MVNCLKNSRHQKIEDNSVQNDWLFFLMGTPPDLITGLLDLQFYPVQ